MSATVDFILGIGIGAVLGTVAATLVWRFLRSRQAGRDTVAASVPAVPLELHAVLNTLGRCTVAAPTDLSLHDGMERLAHYLVSSTPRAAVAPRLREVVQAYWALAQWLHQQDGPLSWSGPETTGPQAAQAAALIHVLKTLDPTAVSALHVDLRPNEAVLQCTLRHPGLINRFDRSWATDTQGRMVQVLRLPT